MKGIAEMFARSGSDEGHRYTFAAVQRALLETWGFSIRRGGRWDERRDGRCDVANSRTGYIVGGYRPGIGYGHRRYASLASVVAAHELSA